MKQRYFAMTGVLIPVLASCVAFAQSSPVVAIGDPTDARAKVPSVVHVSVFRGDASPQVDAPKPWKQTNDTVERIGGWQAYLKEGRQANAPAADAARPESGHSGHTPR